MLRYEKFEEKHKEIYYQWRNDPEVSIFDQSEFLRPRSFDEIATWSEVMVEGYTYVVYKDDVAIGTCALMNPNMRNRYAELAIVIGNKDYWGKGLGKEIMHQLMEWGFEGLNLERLYLHVFGFNERAIKLYENVGFTREGTLRNMIYRNGKYHDVHVYGMMRNEWPKNQ